MSAPPKLTDRKALTAHRTRACAMDDDELHKIATFEIDERLQDVNKEFINPALVGHVPLGLRDVFPHAPTVKDDDIIQLERGAHDLVVHSFGLHWANDPVGQMVQSRLALVPDGLFLGILFGGQTLNELRSVLAETETRLLGGISPRVAPMADVRAMGDLLLRAGFALPVADTVSIVRTFESVKDLARCLRKLGETNALDARIRSASRLDFWQSAEALYSEYFPALDGKNGISATFELIFVTGWAPHDSQQKPMSPGTAKQRLSDALGVTELGSGDVAKPPRR